MAFSVKDWQNTPSAATPLSATAIEDLETRVTDYAALLFSAYNVLDYGADNTGGSDCLAEIQAACDAAANANGGVVYLPAGEYLIDGVLAANQFVVLRGAGMRETIITLNDAGSSVLFNEYPSNSRGGMNGGFHIDGQNLATVCMDVNVAVNRSFKDFRVSRPGASGIALRTEGAQNCNFSDFDLEATAATSNTTGIKVTESSGSCRFSKFSINDFSYAGVHVTQDTAGAQFGIGYAEPRFITFDDGIIERGDPDTTCGIRIHSGRDIWTSRMVLAIGVGETVASGYNLVEVNSSGAGSSRQIYFDRGHSSGNTSASKQSTAFKLTDTSVYTRITNWQFGNNLVGVDMATGHVCELDAYNNTSATTLLSGTGIVSRAMGATSYSTS